MGGGTMIFLQLTLLEVTFFAMPFFARAFLAAWLCQVEAGSSGVAASADETRAFLAELARRSAAMRTLKVSFRQEKKLRILRRPRLSAGDLVYAAGKLSLELREKSDALESKLLFKDGELKIYYPSLERLEVLAVGQGGKPGAGGMNVPFFAGDWRAVEKDYEVVLTWTGGGTGAQKLKIATLTLTPKAKESSVKSVAMTFEEYQVREYRQVDSSGGEVRMEILSWKENEEVPAARFELEVPPGTKTVRLN